MRAHLLDGLGAVQVSLLVGEVLVFLPSLITAEVAKDSELVLGQIVADEFAVLVFALHVRNDDIQGFHERLGKAPEFSLCVFWDDPSHLTSFRADHHAVGEELVASILTT